MRSIRVVELPTEYVLAETGQRPVYLYHIWSDFNGTVQHWHFTSHPLDIEIAGQEFRARDSCIDISQEELDTDDDQLLEFIEDQNVQIVPAMQAVQLVVVNEDGTAEGTILFMRNVPGGCEAMTPEFKAKFDADFERFIASIRAAN